MLLKNLMGDKKLNFNRPLLSVRRYSPMLTSQKVDEKKIDNARPITSRPPPYRSELKSGPVGNPGAVPFQWEQIPGRPKEYIKPQIQNCDRSPIAPKLPPGRYPNAQHDSHQVSLSNRDNEIQAVNIRHDSLNDSSVDENIKFFERSKDVTEESKSSDSGVCDEAYVEAFDSLSRSQSFFLSCSMSGLTGMDDLDANTSASLSTDPQTQEFMMDRFLPAAKAMVTEPPQYALKKPSAVEEQPQQLNRKRVNQDKPALRYGPSFAKRYSHFHNNDEEEESDDDCDQHENLPAVCCLLPQFCLKSSVCLLNPVPAMSVRTQVLASPANRLQPRSSSAGSFSKTGNEYKSGISELQHADRGQTENKTSLRNESGQLESQKTLTYCHSPLSFLEVKEVFGSSEETVNAGIKTFQELLAAQGSLKELDSGGSLVEKTDYVHTVQKVGNVRSSSPNTEDTVVPGSRDNETNTKRKDQMHVIDSSLEDFKKLETVDGGAKLRSNAHKSGDFKIVSSIDKLDRFKLGSATTENTEVAEKEASKNAGKGNSPRKYSEFPFPPPLPTPSDSWLRRTLYLGATINSQIHGSKAPTRDVKWEAKVKSTKVQHPNLHCSEVAENDNVDRFLSENFRSILGKNSLKLH